MTTTKGLLRQTWNKLPEEYEIFSRDRDLYLARLREDVHGIEEIRSKLGTLGNTIGKSLIPLMGHLEHAVLYHNLVHYPAAYGCTISRVEWAYDKELPGATEQSYGEILERVEHGESGIGFAEGQLSRFYHDGLVDGAERIVALTKPQNRREIWRDLKEATRFVKLLQGEQNDN